MIEIHGKSNAWRTIQRPEKSLGLDADMGLETSNGSVGFGKLCASLYVYFKEGKSFCP